MVVTTPGVKAKPPSPVAIGCAVLGLLGIAWFFGFALFSALTHPAKPVIPIGTQAHVQNDTYTVLVMGLSEAAFDHLSKAVADNDRIGVEQVLLSGQFFEVPSGTSVLVLGWNLGQGTTNVRVLSGTQTGKVAWVWTAYVVP